MAAYLTHNSPRWLTAMVLCHFFIVNCLIQDYFFVMYVLSICAYAHTDID